MASQQLGVKDFEWQVLINPNACDKKCFTNWESISQKLTQHNIRHEMHKADACGRGMAITKELCQQGHRHIMVIGGDGTINEVVNGIFTAGIDTQEVYLAVLPLGRGNDWARTHNFPNNCLDSIDVFLQGKFLSHDIGCVKTIRENSTIAERFFINIAGFCFDADVIYDTVYNKPHFLGISVYILSLIRTLFKFKSPKITIKSDNYEYDGKSLITVAANCQYNGGGMRQAPYALPDDGLLDVVVIPNVCKLRVIANIKRLFAGTHIDHISEIQSHKTHHLSISSQQLIRGEVEGELLEVGNYDISLIPHALNTLTNRD